MVISILHTLTPYIRIEIKSQNIKFNILKLKLDVIILEL